MNVKEILTFFNLYRKLKNFKKESVMNLGWKTIVGAILVGLGYAAKTLTSIDPMFDEIGDGLIAAGAVLGGVGLRIAIAKTGVLREK